MWCTEPHAFQSVIVSHKPAPSKLDALPTYAFAAFLDVSALDHLVFFLLAPSHLVFAAPSCGAESCTANAVFQALQAAAETRSQRDGATTTGQTALKHVRAAEVVAGHSAHERAHR